MTTDATTCPCAATEYVTWLPPQYRPVVIQLNFTPTFDSPINQQLLPNDLPKERYATEEDLLRLEPMADSDNSPRVYKGLDGVLYEMIVTLKEGVFYSPYAKPRPFVIDLSLLSKNLPKMSDSQAWPTLFEKL